MQRLPLYARTIGLALFGALAAATSPVPLEWTWTGFIGPAFLLAALEAGWRYRPPGVAADPLGLYGPAPSAKRGFLAGWLFSTTINVAALYWVVGLLVDFGSFPWIGAFFTALLLWTSQGVAYGIAGALAAALMRAGARGFFALPFAITVLSALVPSLFPWRIGYSQIGFPLFVQMADIGGEPLLDLAVSTVACGAYDALVHRSRAAAIAAIVAFALPLGYGAIRIADVQSDMDEARVLRVGVVQPNVGIWEKRDRRLARDHLAELQDMTAGLEARGAELVLWPESAYPYPIPRDLEEDPGGPMSVRGGRFDVPLLFGSVTYEPPRYGNARYNSVVALNGAGRITGISDKVVLLAFGEYTPLWEQVALIRENFPRGFTPGREALVLETEGIRVGVLNCYEDVIAHHGRVVGRQVPDFVINVTNDAWFGDTSEPFLHQMVARLRAIEIRRDLVRAVNTGTSSHTLATGVDVFKTDTFTDAAIVTGVHLLHETTVWTRVGDWVTPVCFGALLGAAIALRPRFPASVEGRRKKRAKKKTTRKTKARAT
jgi:apolipoprotein N-acyltransferase